MGQPTAERPPEGLSAYWLGVWRHALKVLKERKTWAWEQRPLLDEYVYALMAAEDARNGFKWLDALEQYAENADDLPNIAWTVLQQIAGGVPTQWDRHTKRAAALADQLALTPRGQKAVTAGARDDAKQAKDPFGEFDEVAKARERREATR